jgi:ABC-type multidrug transport system ATPase subunit
MNRKVGLVSADGGTISNLSGWENILLPAQYFSATDEARELWKTERFLEQAEIDEQSIRHMLLTPASQLSLFERKMIGFARAMQMKPELLILDMIFENMTEIECATLRKLNGIFHLHFPFRTAIFLDVHQTHDNVKADRVFYI